MYQSATVVGTSNPLFMTNQAKVFVAENEEAARKEIQDPVETRLVQDDDVLGP